MVLEKLAGRAPMSPGDHGSIWLMAGLCSVIGEGGHKFQEDRGSLSQEEQRGISDGTHPGSATSACWCRTQQLSAAWCLCCVADTRQFQYTNHDVYTRQFSSD